MDEQPQCLRCQRSDEVIAATSTFGSHYCRACDFQFFAPESDPVNHPPHYTAHPSGVECITVTEHMGFCLGNAIKYIWRADLKGDAIEDLEKAQWYLAREIERRKNAAKKEAA